MTKISKAFRLHPKALDKLTDLEDLTGTNQTALLEQAISWYHRALKQGLLTHVAVKETISRAENPQAAAQRKQIQPLANNSQQLEEEEDLASVFTGPVVTFNLDEAEMTEPEEASEDLEPYRLHVNGQDFFLDFPVADIPQSGSDPCPCGSGEIFARCHNKDFKQALKAGLTSRRA